MNDQEAWEQLHGTTILTESGEVFEETKDIKKPKSLDEIAERMKRDYINSKKLNIAKGLNGQRIQTRSLNGKKNDNNKPQWSLLPLDVIEQLVKVMTYGKIKYNEKDLKNANWKKVEPKERYEDALWRHIKARQCGELLDPESGELHSAHAMFNIMCLVWHDMNTIKESENE